MENLTGTHVSDIRDRGEILVPADRRGRGRRAARPGRPPRAGVDPTGDAALIYNQVAAVLTDVLGRDISYRRPGLIRYARHARQILGMPWGMVAVTAGIYTVARLGRAAAATDDVRAVTGTAPTTFKDWALEHKDEWARI